MANKAVFVEWLTEWGKGYLTELNKLFARKATVDTLAEQVSELGTKTQYTAAAVETAIDMRSQTCFVQNGIAYVNVNFRVSESIASSGQALISNLPIPDFPTPCFLHRINNGYFPGVYYSCLITNHGELRFDNPSATLEPSPAGGGYIGYQFVAVYPISTT